MSDPQRPQVPPYASNAAGQHPHPGSMAKPSTTQASATPPTYHPGQQQATPQGYVLNGQSAQFPPVSAASVNVPGRIGFILGLVGLGLGLVLNVIIQSMIRSGDYQIVSVISGPVSFIVFIAAVLALVFGLIGLKRRASQAQAGIATGLGIAGVASGIFSFISSFLFYF